MIHAGYLLRRAPREPSLHEIACHGIRVLFRRAQGRKQRWARLFQSGGAPEEAVFFYRIKRPVFRTQPVVCDRAIDAAARRCSGIAKHQQASWRQPGS